MSRRMHEARTSDGVTLRGSVHGEGPPVVFWHGAFGDGDLDWAAVLPYLADRRGAQPARSATPRIISAGVAGSDVVASPR